MRGAAAVVASIFSAFLAVSAAGEKQTKPVPATAPPAASSIIARRSSSSGSRIYLDRRATHTGSNAGGRRCRQSADQGDAARRMSDHGRRNRGGCAYRPRHEPILRGASRAIDKGVELATNYARQKGSDQETLADPSMVRIDGFYALTMAPHAVPLRQVPRRRCRPRWATRGERFRAAVESTRGNLCKR